MPRVAKELGPLDLKRATHAGGKGNTMLSVGGDDPDPMAKRIAAKATLAAAARKGLTFSEAANR